MTARTDEELISGYLKHYKSGDEADFWAFSDISELTRTEPERVWALTLEMIRRTNDEATLSYVAAGPLEDLLSGYGETFIDRAEVLARTDPHFRAALAAVWIGADVDPDIHKRVEKAVGRSAK